MNKKQQPEALRLAEMLTANEWPGHVTLVSYAQECVAELRRQHARIAELEAEIAAVGAGGVQALSAAPATPTAEQQVQPGAVGRTGCTAGTDEECTRRGCATSCPAQQAAPKAAPGVGNSGFDHKTAADFLSGKTVSDEAVRKFVQASRWAHDERAALSAKLLAMHGVLTSREAEIALLKKALLEAESAPQQEAQEPVAWLNPWRADQVTTDYDAYGEHGIALYTAPQPAPTPLSEMPYEKRKAIQEGEQIGASDAWFKARHEMLDTVDRRNVFRAGFDRGWSAALAAQGGRA